eukprot:322804_1
MALSTKDGLWDRNFQSYEQEELEKDTEFDDEIKIEWAHLSCLKRRNASTLTVGNDKSCHMFNALLKPKYFQIATITYAHHTVDVTNSQRGIAQNVVIYSNKDPTKSTQQQSCGNAAALIATRGALIDEEATKPEHIFVYAPNVPAIYNYCISEFILFHFRPQQVICLDLLSRGNYVQNYDELQIPQIRKVVTQTVYDKINGNKDASDEKKEETQRMNMEFVDGIQYLETGNFISSFAAAVLQQCEYNGTDGYLFVSISDLDYLTETLISFGNILVDFCPSLSHVLGVKKSNKLRSIVSKRCAKYGNKMGHVLTGRDMFC